MSPSGYLATVLVAFRGLYLCGDPFPVSAIASLPSVRDEYLYVNHRPDVIETSGTEMVNASNILVQDSIRPQER